MGARFAKLRARLRYSFWFLPALISLGGAGLSLLLSRADMVLQTPRLHELIPLDVEGMRETLAMVASSMITVATTALSIVVVALQLASAHLGPRLLRNFVRDRANQVSFGVFIGTFLYCLLLMRFLGNGRPQSELPVIGFAGAMVMTAGGVAVLIIFIHHAALSIQKDRVVARVSEELMESLDLLYPKAIGSPPPLLGTPDSPAQSFPQEAHGSWESAEAVLLSDSGYVQAVESAKLMRITRKYGLCVQLNERSSRTLLLCLTNLWRLPFARSPAEQRTVQIDRHLESARRSVA